MSTFTLSVDGEPPVTVEFAVPAGWSPDTSGSDPAWQRAGALLLSVVAVSPSGDDEVRMRKAIRMQYGEVADGERTDLGDGRVWIARQEGENLHARMFVPYAGGVVMGVAILGPDGAGALSEVRAAYDTLRVAA